MLTPGEFVIRKSSVKKLGAENIAKMNAGGKATKFNESKGLVYNRNVDRNKQAGTEFNQSFNRFDAQDDFIINRINDRTIDVNDLDGRSKGVRQYKNAVLAGNDRERGKAFESVVAGQNPNLKLAKADDARIDSILNNQLYEIKSTIKRLSDGELAEKVIGGSLRPKDSVTDAALARRLTKARLTAGRQRNKEFDKINLGSVGVIQDKTNLSQINRDLKEKDGSDVVKGAGAGQKGRKAVNFGSRFKKGARFFGGAIQKFALGGLAQKNKVGFAILDPDEGGADLSASVTRAQIRGAVKGTDAQKKALDKELSWPSKKFNVARQGLPAKTSKKFYDTIIQEAVTGVDTAANSLSQSLGQGAISMPESAKSTMAGVIGKSGSQMGSLFEDTLNVIDNAGDFKPAPKGAFWDFKGGLTGGLATTYNKMPSSFVDARTSYGRSSADAAQGKIIGEIAEEYQKSATYANAKKQVKAAPASAVAAQQKRRAKQAAKMAKMREKAGFAKGGPAPSDTVPAMLTPGEFVINKKAAARIGAANLDRMNKQGVAGFAKGGPVGGVQFLNPGGEVQRLQQIEANLASSLESITSQFEKADADSKALSSSKPEAQARANAAGASPEDQANLQKVLQEEVKAREAYLATSSKKEQVELQLITIQEKLAKKLEGQALGKEIAAEAKGQQASSVNQPTATQKPSPEAVKVAENARERAAAKQGAGAGDILRSRGKSSEKPVAPLGESIEKAASLLSKAVEAAQKSAKPESAPKGKGVFGSKELELQPAPKLNRAEGIKQLNTKDALSNAESELNQKKKKPLASISKSVAKDSKVSDKGPSSKGLATEKTLLTLGKNFSNYAKASIKLFSTLGTEKTLLTFGKNFNTAAKSGALRGSGGAAPAAKEVKQGKDLFDDIDSSNVKFKDSGPSKKESLKSDTAQKAIASAEATEAKQQKAIGQIEGRKEKAKKGRNPKETIDGNADSNRMTNLLLGATAMAAFVPQVEGATEGVGALTNEIPGIVGGFAAMQGIAAGIPEGQNALTKGLFKAGKGALQTASFTAAANKAIDAYNGTHLQAEQAVKAASEANDEASLAAAEKAAVESANANNLNKAGMTVTAGFGALAGVAEMIPGPWGKVLGIGLKVAGGLAGLAVKLGALEAIGISGDDITNFFAILGMGPSVNQTKAQTSATIQNARSQKALAEASKDAAEELKKIEAGELSATQSLGIGGAADRSAQAIAAQNQASNALIRSNNQANAAMEKISDGFKSQGTTEGMVLGAGYDFLTGGQRAANKQQTEAERKAQLERNSKLINDLQPRLGLAAREQVTAASAGGRDLSFDKFTDSIAPSVLALARQTDAANGNTAEMDKLRKNFENVKKATIENIKFIKAMNFGLSDVTSGIAAYGASLNNLTASQETGFSTAAVAATTLSTAISSAGKNISSGELGSSLDLLEGNLRKFGANTKQIDSARELITGLNTVQKGAADALAAVKGGFAGGATDPKAIQGQLKDAILSSIPDSSPIKQKLLDSFGNLELPPEAIENFLNTGDVSGILDQAFGPVQEQVKKQLIEPLNRLAEQEKVLVGLAIQRRDAEQKLISVQKQAIDTQIDAAKNLELFGGAKFTPEKEFDARRRQANLTLQDAGVAGLATGSAADIRAASDSIMAQFSNQQARQNAAAIKGGGVFGGVEGVNQDRREELKASNQALIDITRSGIEQRKQELELIKKKNQAEKDALNSLLGGDVESFFDQAIGAAAGSALRTGDAAAASFFNAGALGKGLQGLQGTGLTDDENKRASQLAFGAFGLGEDAARTFSGTTTEEERIKSEGRELSQLQSELADQSVDLEQMTVSATTVVITAANLKMQEISDQVTQAQAIAGFNRGGVVYANKGMFIPRGTDTVPAMLTPGEFVVNRAAVQRGNNLQMLRSMNSNSAPAQALSSGGPVRYRANGSTGPEGPGGIDFSKFEDMVNKFQEVTDKLGNVNIKHMFEKLGTLDINHMFNGNMQQAFKDEILAEAGDMMSRSKFNNDGSITTSDRSVLG